MTFDNLAGRITVYIDGDIHGNSQRTVIDIPGDEQWPQVSFERKRDGGFRMTVLGAWEIRDLANALEEALVKLATLKSRPLPAYKFSDDVVESIGSFV